MAKQAQRVRKETLIHNSFIDSGTYSCGFFVVFFECGVGRVNKKGDWKIVTGMLRLGTRGQKKSVVAKRVAKLRKQPVELFVSRVDVHGARFEVCTSQQDALEENKKVVKKTPASALKPGEEVIGRVAMLRPYGAMVDVGANRLGLLHIVKVADLYERYIDKEKGLEEAGLKVGTRIRVCVASNANKRLFLDFTQDVKKEAGVVLETSDSPKQQIKEQLQNTIIPTTVKQVETLSTEAQPFALSPEEEAAWAAYVTDGESSDQDGLGGEDESEEQEDYDDYDEDRDIEDALGLGRY
jgi:predicted RNA-binding protein with RPS1 domain